MADERGGNLLKKKSFWVRTVSGLILALILVAVFIIGYEVLWAFVLLLSLVGEYELYKAIGLEWKLFCFVGYATTIAYYVLLLLYGISSYLILALAVMVIVNLAVFVFTYPKYSIMQCFGATFAVVYIGVLLSFLFLLRIFPPYGAYIVWLVFISAWGCDIFAYLTGMLFGKRKLVPKLSPNKSVEGAIGGLVGAVVLALVYALIISKYIPEIKAWLVFPIVALFGAAAGQIGDLAASAIKRLTGIKDYGKIIPGHGGVLDRFDSVIMVAPIIYCITLWFKIMPVFF